MKVLSSILVLLASFASALGDRDLKQSPGNQYPKLTNPCVWVDGGCYYDEQIAIRDILDYKKLTTREAQEYYKFLVNSQKSKSCYSKYKNKDACNADLTNQCFWYPEGGNRVEGSKPSCDQHPLASDYALYWMSYKFACPMSKGGLDFKCALLNTQGQCSGVVGCKWAPGQRTFPCGAADTGLTAQQKKLMPSNRQQGGGTTSLSDYQAVFGKCASSAKAFAQQVCPTINKQQCQSAPYNKDCIWDGGIAFCTPRTTFWFGQALGGDKAMVRVFFALENGCKVIKKASTCTAWQYKDIAWLK